MPERKTMERAARDKRQGKSASTQAGEFVREEIDHVREGKHGVRSSKQAIAIGLSKARRAGVKAPVSKKASAATKDKAEQDNKAAHDGHAKSAKRARATTTALKKESAKPASVEARARPSAGSPIACRAHARRRSSRRTVVESMGESAAGSKREG